MSAAEPPASSTDPAGLDLPELLDRINQKMTIDKIAEEIGVHRSLVFDWKRIQRGEEPSKTVKAATVEEINEGIRRLAVKMGILPPSSAK